MNDAPEPRVYRPQRGIDPATRRLALIAGVIGAVLVVVVGGWSLSGRHSGTVPVFEPLPGPIKVKPVDPGGLQLQGAEPPPKVDAASTGGSGEHLAPGPEQPDPARLAAELAARAGPAPAASTPTAAAPSAPPTTPAAPAAEAPAPSAPAAPAPAATTPAPSAASSQPAPTRPPTEPTGHIEVQLAAMDSRALADAEWQRLSHRMQPLFQGRTPLVAAIQRDGHTYWRLRTGGFATIADATRFCEGVHEGRAPCTIAAF